MRGLQVTAGFYQLLPELCIGSRKLSMSDHNMSNYPNRHTIYTVYPNAVHLNPEYLQLEGFTETQADTETIITMADVVDEAVQLPDSAWKDTFKSFGVIFALLLVSSLTLGYTAYRITEGLQHMAYQINRHMLEYY